MNRSPRNASSCSAFLAMVAFMSRRQNGVVGREQYHLSVTHVLAKTSFLTAEALREDLANVYGAQAEHVCRLTQERSARVPHRCLRYLVSRAGARDSDR